MKYKRIILITKRYVLLLMFSFLVTFAWCESWDDSYDYKIKVDTFAFPIPWVTHTDTLHVAFWGKIGDDTCSKFARFDISKDSSHADITVWGHKSVLYRVACPSGTTYLNGKQYGIYPLKTGAFTVTINEPDGSKIQQQIWIH
ncbi:MAG: hypothetical protein ACHQJ4_02745 [Ignavibacteria bacterium]